MKYWKGQAATPKEGLCGTMDDGATVPDAVAATKAEYDAYLASQPAPPVQPDYSAEFVAASTTEAKVQVIAAKLGLI